MNNLIEKNKELLEKYNNNQTLKEKQLIIARFLKNKNCFFNIRIEEAYNILKDLEIENYEEVYLELISYNTYINLIENP